MLNASYAAEPSPRQMRMSLQGRFRADAEVI